MSSHADGVVGNVMRIKVCGLDPVQICVGNEAALICVVPMCVHDNAK